jgi:hypothetical protein
MDDDDKSVDMKRKGPGRPKILPHKKKLGWPKKVIKSSADTPHVEDVAVMKMKDSVGLGLAATTPSQNVDGSVGGQQKDTKNYCAMAFKIPSTLKK